MSPQLFLSTLSLRRATQPHFPCTELYQHFYPRSPCGERHYCDHDTDWIRDFYPRSPCGERRCVNINPPGLINFYPRSPCGERRVYVSYNMYNNTISIHALLAESDSLGNVRGCLFCIFLSTLSLRRATMGCILLLPLFLHFYPRSPCGERRLCSCFLRSRDFISIHALLAESDGSLFLACWCVCDFYPRSPCGERPPGRAPLSRVIVISIHALLAESDHSQRSRKQHHPHFYPRSPCGERL